MAELKTLFLQGFDNNVRARELALLLENRVGPLKRVDIPPTKKNYNFAFVEFERNDLADKAVKLLNGVDLGRFKLLIREAKHGKDQFVQDNYQNIPTRPRVEERLRLQHHDVREQREPYPQEQQQHVRERLRYDEDEKEVYDDKSYLRQHSRSPTPPYRGRSRSRSRTRSPNRLRSPSTRAKSRSVSVCSYDSKISSIRSVRYEKIRELSPSEDIIINDEDVLDME